MRYPTPLILFTLLLLSSACSSLSPYSRLTKLDLELGASDQLNPDLEGRPSPIVVRLFELRHPAAFENADFFSLYQRAKETLGPDLAASEELELRPGETLTLKLRAAEGSRYIGVLAAYRNLPDSQWRQVLPLNPAQLTQARLRLARDGIHETGADTAQEED